LHTMLSSISEELGGAPLPALDPSRRGAADISFVAPYSDALAGLGGQGENQHSPEERLDLNSLSIAIKRSAVMIYRLTR
jgi:glutamate carboxypeptidase